MLRLIILLQMIKLCCKRVWIDPEQKNTYLIICLFLLHPHYMSHISNFTTFVTLFLAEMGFYTLFADQMIWGVKLLDRPVRDQWRYHPEIMITWKHWNQRRFIFVQSMIVLQNYNSGNEVEILPMEKIEKTLLSEGSSNQRVSITNPDYFLSDFGNMQQIMYSLLMR